ncbi:MAG: hypothetical protein M3365_01855 [Gemmatimonadota bacterium]|nr:hypothetical protein [Gemmatimonadota bacterium]
MIFRHAAKPPATERKRFSPSLVISVGVHAVVATALMRMLILSADDFTTRKKQPAEQGERVSFVAVAQPDAAPQTMGRVGGDGRPVQSREIRVVAPVVAPQGIPAPNPDDAPTVEAGNGPLVGGGGPVRGVRPSYSDPRLWQPPTRIVSPPKSVAETIDALIVEGIKPYNDSIARVAERRDPTDWTVEKGGYKWGIDKRAIRLGPVSIPTALLALLPLNLQGNPIQMDRDRTYAAMHRDISWHAQQGVNEADFVKAVRSIRERKERERAAALAGSPGTAKDESALPR